MTIETLEKKIANRANANVQARITAFRKAVREACVQLGVMRGDSSISYISAAEGVPESQAVLRLLARDTNDQWPAYLWRQEEEKVRQEIMALLDPLQRVLLAPEPSFSGPRPSVLGLMPEDK